MGTSEVLILNFIAFVVMPITVETTICLNPSPIHRGAVCNWEEKNWEVKFDIETMEYYYELKPTDQSDNFIEKKMRKRFLDNGKRVQYIKKN
tara:strand:- start:1423 stop:1698 length:276 start_codon:yes stop_codon:yes gene_type:complete